MFTFLKRYFKKPITLKIDWGHLNRGLSVVGAMPTVHISYKHDRKFFHSPYISANDRMSKYVESHPGFK